MKGYQWIPSIPKTERKKKTTMINRAARFSEAFDEFRNDGKKPMSLKEELTYIPREIEDDEREDWKEWRIFFLH